MADQVLDTPVPVGDAVLSTPVERNTVDPIQQDIEVTQQTRTPFARGVRAGFNQIGSMGHALAGNIGETLGLTDFANTRFADAEQMATFADAVGPDIKDYRQVKDFGTLARFVTGLAGQGAAMFAPAVAGIGAGAALGGGLRGAFAGGALGSFVPNAGEQAMRLHQEPGDSSAGARTANAFAVGGANALLDVGLPLAGYARFAKPALRTGGIASTGAKAAGVEGVTEGLQEVVGQAGHAALVPGRDKSEDVPDIINSALQGAVAGAGFGVAQRGGERGVDALRRALRDRRPITNEDDLDALSNKDATVDDVLAEMADKEGKVNDQLAQEFPGIDLDDPVTREEKKAESRQKFDDEVTKPRSEAALRGLDLEQKSSVGPKKSLQRTTLDAKILDNMLKDANDSVSSLSPDQQYELAGALKHFGMHGFGKRTEVAGPGRAARGEDAAGKATVRESDRATVREQIPPELLHFFGKDTVRKLQETNKILSGGGIARPREFKQALAETGRTVRQRKTKLAAAIHEHLKRPIFVNAEKRQVATEGFERMLNDTSKEADERLQDAAVLLFDDPKKALDAIQDRDGDPFAQHFNLTDEEADSYLPEDEEASKGRDLAEEMGIAPKKEAEQGVYNDERLNVPDTLDGAMATAKGMEEADIYDKKKVRFEVHEQMVPDADGNIKGTGKYVVSAHDAEGIDALSKAQWRRIRNKSKDAGFANGAIMVLTKDRPKGDAVSIPSLTAEAMSATDRPGQGQVKYVPDMVMRGLALLLGDPNVTGLGTSTKKELGLGSDPAQWDIPDGTLVAVHEGKRWTWGDVKESLSISTDELAIRRMTSNAVEAAQRADSRKDILGGLEPGPGPVAQKRARLVVTQQRTERPSRSGKNTVKEDKVVGLSVERTEGGSQEVDDPVASGGILGAFREKTARVKAVLDGFKKNQKGYKTAKSHYDRMLGAEESILAEVDRREREGDHPIGAIGVSNVDKKITEGDLGKKEGVRRVQEETGETLTGAPTKPRGRASQPHETGISEEAREPGPVWSKQADALAAIAALGPDNAAQLAAAKQVRPSATKLQDLNIEQLRQVYSMLKKAEPQVLPLKLEGKFRQWLAKHPGKTVADWVRQQEHEKPYIEAAKNRTPQDFYNELIDHYEHVVQPLDEAYNIPRPDNMATAAHEYARKYMSSGDIARVRRKGMHDVNEPKKSLMSNRVKEDSDHGGGFAAAHDSPIKHEGKFDWRKNLGKGEGHAAYGAGTYLSTAEGVHKSYKGKFSANSVAPMDLTEEAAREYKQLGLAVAKADADVLNINSAIAEDPNSLDADRWYDALDDAQASLDDAQIALKAFEDKHRKGSKGFTDRASPTYHVTVNATQDEILNWDKPLGEQKEIRNKIYNAISEDPALSEQFDHPSSMTGSEMYERLARALPDPGNKVTLKEISEADLIRGKQEKNKFGYVNTQLHRQDFRGGYLNLSEVVSGKDGSVLYNISPMFDGPLMGRQANSAKTLADAVAKYNAIARDLQFPRSFGKDKGAAQARASEFLQKAGIVGHRFAAHGGKNDKFPNYVIYDDSRIETKFVEFSEQKVGTKPLTEKQKAEAREYVLRVLGPKAEAWFKNLAHAGEFELDGDVEVLRISNWATDPMGTARHEAAHALILRLMKANKQAAQQLLAAAGSPHVIERLRSLLKGHPEAIKQLSDPEERLAYMYQFWAAGEPGMAGPKAATWFERVKRFLRVLAGLWSETTNDMLNVGRAEAIFDLFERGELADRNTVAEVLREKAPKLAYDRATEVMGPIYDFLAKAVFTSDGFVRSMNIPAFNGVADKFLTPLGRQMQAPGYMQTKHTASNEPLVRLYKVLEGTTEAEQRAALEVMQTNGRATGKSVRIVADIRAILRDLFDYMQEHKVKAVVWSDSKRAYEEFEMRFVKDYFPRMYDKSNILANRVAFVKMLRDNTTMSNKEATDMMDRITRGQAATDENDEEIGLTYYAPNTLSRKLDIPADKLAPFMVKDLNTIMSAYIIHAARRGEYASRFGNQGEVISAAVKQAEAEGATPEQVRNFNQAVQAWEGSLGHHIRPELKNTFGALVTYQNVRLLPLALFSSLVDPIGIAVRGGGPTQAFSAFVRGVRDMGSTVQDAGFDLAEAIGAIARAHDSHMIADAYGSQYLPQALQRANRAFFRFNGMESWNRSMRVQAAVASELFIMRHVTKPNEHSERYLRELNLTKGDVKIVDGHVVLNDKVKAAMNLWIDGAVLRPTASIRPIWMSDPHWMLVSHLKQFTYSFQKTIIARVVHEMANGNFTPAYALVSYVPAIIAADIARAMLTPGGGDDRALEKLGLGGILARGAQRSGLFGPGEYALNAYGDLGHAKPPLVSLSGPTFQQLYDMSTAASGAGDVGKEFARSVPGYVFIR